MIKKDFLTITTRHCEIKQLLPKTNLKSTLALPSLLEQSNSLVYDNREFDANEQFVFNDSVSDTVISGNHLHMLLTHCGVALYTFINIDFDYRLSNTN